MTHDFTPSARDMFHSPREQLLYGRSHCLVLGMWYWQRSGRSKSAGAGAGAGADAGAGAGAGAGA
eukprot:CAMPEP_0202099770 /NCGR_PEP_ID=MMETSP0965-20130614/2733_1 /ASSEMBLY_ACC=CAM_ASM_000507 /TAXON_ID=4773 /ORGANISM="Schizochytrium aggregatum, Strain ATCC28209" /LENGTH=64 /DNA_ID=CAMNT_0048668375 /DNA_START=57 /DNA_END=247 /DNA_ORIENTATION=-